MNIQNTNVKINTESSVDFIKNLERDAVRPVTSAPLQMAGQFHFDADKDTVFNRISEVDQVAAWFPLLRGGDLNHETSCNVGSMGAGTKRTCYTNGMGTLYETIHYWDAPNAYAYEVKNFMMPIKNHLALMAVEPSSNGGSIFTWHQYFDLKGVAMRHVFPTMMIGLMNKGMMNLRKELGGTGGKMKSV